MGSDTYKVTNETHEMTIFGETGNLDVSIMTSTNVVDPAKMLYDVILKVVPDKGAQPNNMFFATFSTHSDAQAVIDALKKSHRTGIFE